MRLKKKETTKNEIFTVWPLLSSAECMFCNTRFIWERGWGWQAGSNHCEYSCRSCCSTKTIFDMWITELKNRRKLVMEDNLKNLITTPKMKKSN